MLTHRAIRREYDEAGSVNALLALWAFVDEGTFVTKAGDVGVVYRLQGQDYEGLDHAQRRHVVHRFEAALRLLGDRSRVYQYFFKRQAPPIAAAACASPVIDQAVPDTEEILDVLCGDKEFWVINASHNIAHLKPAKEGAATNLNLVTASGTVYSFLLAEGKGAPDLKVYVTADPDASPKKPKYYSAKEVSDLQTALTDARVAIETVEHRSNETLADFRKTYPSTLQFAYATPAYGKPFFVKSIWHDDRFTYIKADARELPTLYEVTGDGAPALVNFQVENGTYVVPKVLERGYLALGSQKLEFQTRETKGR